MHSILKRGCTWTHCSFHSLWQETEIDSIHQLVVGATENVKEGNEDIREVTFPIWKQAAINSACVIYALCYVFLWLMSINLINKLILFTSITRQSKTMLASGFGSCSSWSCALSLSSSWTEVVVDHRKNSCCIAVADEDPKKRNKTLYHEAPIRKSTTTKHSTYLRWFGL